MAITIQTTQYNLIYVYSRKEIPDALKIGKASINEPESTRDALTPNCDKLNQAAIECIKTQTQRAAADFTLLHTELAWFEQTDGNGAKFMDTDVHEVLLQSGYKRKEFHSEVIHPTEWFKVSLETAVKAIEAVKNEQIRIDGPRLMERPKPVIRFREEQTSAIQQTIAHFRTGKKMLWNAKMRFGKTLCALELIRRQQYGRVLILTHRPAVRSGWFEDYHLIDFEHTQYGSKNGLQLATCSVDDDLGKDFATLERDFTCEGTHYIYFASMQDLRGSRLVSDKGIDKNHEVFQTPWDLIIIDEAHEGTKTPLGKSVISELCNHKDPYLLYLSGTPYKILSLFSEEEIFTWDYIMEQNAKNGWAEQHPDEPNPYEGLAQLNIYTYDLGEVFQINDYTRTEDDFFNFEEFFRTWTGNEQVDGVPLPSADAKGRFVHEADVIRFLDMLCEDSDASYYPFSTEVFREELRHTLWMLPGVKAAHALERLIKHHDLGTKLHFTVINVAGEGSKIDGLDEDEAQEIEKLGNNMLQKVKAAIKTCTRTITLSCGRLTTGVSVPEWTGVFMMRSGNDIDAGYYMQTIFRGQTPFKNGATKTNCYAFDFAPDRTLSVIENYAESQPRKSSGHTSRTKTERIVDMLRLCPVIAMKGGKEVVYDAHRLIDEVNRAYREHVLSNGFKGRMLHKDFASFTEKDYETLQKIGKVLAGNKVKLTSDGRVKMSESGLTGEDGKKKAPKKAGRAPKSTKTSKKNSDIRTKSQAVLDQIFVRLPLMLFGAVEDVNHLSIAELTEVIDDESWEVFMPLGFTKNMLQQIAHLIKEDLLISCTAQIINDARGADALPVEQRVVEIARMLSTFHYPDRETVLTPWRVVNMHLGDTLGGFNFYHEGYCQLADEPRWIDRSEVTQQVFCTEEPQILEINSKSGVYPLYLTYTLWRLACDKAGMLSAEEQLRVWDEVLARNVFVLCQTQMAQRITERVLRGYRQAETHCQVYPQLIKTLLGKGSRQEKARKEKLIKKLCTTEFWNLNNGSKLMKFNAVVSNPPYNVKDGGAGASATPLYHHFVDLAKNLKAPIISMIMPAKWYSDGKGLEAFRATMLGDRHIVALFDFVDSRDCFDNVDVAGGICYFLRDIAHKGDCRFTCVSKGKSATSLRNLAQTDTFIRFDEALIIMDKVKAQTTDFYSSKVSTRKPFGLATNAQPLKEGDITLRYNQGKGKYKSELITKGNEMIPLWKVIISYLAAEHAGQTDKNGQKKILSSLGILEPNEICTETYLVVDAFRTEQEAQALYKYLSTRLVRFLISILASTQHITKEKFAYVPLQDFTSSADIDWSQTVDVINRQLYDKYQLTEEECRFVENMIKPM